MENNKVTIHIVDDDPSTRKYLQELVSTIKFKTKVYDSASDFLESYRDEGVGCLLLDLRMPEISGLDLQSQLISSTIDLPVIMITGYGDVPTAVKAMKAGVFDFVEKPFRAKFMIDRINNAVKQHKQTRKNKQADKDIIKLIDSLTNREKEVMDLVIKGKQNKDIALDLEISVKTVEVHRANVMNKMQANSIVELVRMCLQIKETEENS